MKVVLSWSEKGNKDTILCQSLSDGGFRWKIKGRTDGWNGPFNHSAGRKLSRLAKERETIKEELANAKDALVESRHEVITLRCRIVELETT